MMERAVQQATTKYTLSRVVAKRSTLFHHNRNVHSWLITHRISLGALELGIGRYGRQGGACSGNA